MNAYQWCSALTPLLLIVFALTLGPEEFPPGGPALKGGHQPRQQRPKMADERSQKPSFPIRPPAEIDHEGFIASFRRQSMSEVLPCLRNWQRPPATILVHAVLTKGGKLENLRGAHQTRDLPSCFAPAVGKLDFAPLMESLDRPSVEISWRIDW